MLRILLAMLTLWPTLLAAQGDTAIPLFLGQQALLLPPTVDGGGRSVVFGSTVTPDGQILGTMDLYVASVDGSGLRRLTRLAGDNLPPQGATAVSQAANATRAAFAALIPARLRFGGFGEQVHVVDVATAADRVVATDTEGCIQPLVLACPNCFFPCLNTPHISNDGAKVLYAARRPQPFFVVNADGSGLIRLPVYSGGLAPAPQRVISRNIQVAFTSSAPSGPTFAASATDVYLMNLDGTNVRPVTRFGNDTSIYAFNATISADGGMLAFQLTRSPAVISSSGTTIDTQIWVVRSDGSGLRALTTGSEPSTAPSISGDGSLVAFVRAGQIYIIRSDGTGLRALTNFRMSTAQEPAVSDDGTRVVFSLGPRGGGRGAIYSIRSDGTELRQVYAPRALNQFGVVGGDAGVPPSPGSLLSAYGINLAADGLATAGRFPLPESLAGVSLLVNGRPAPLLAVTPWQVNAQLPMETPEGPAAFQFRFADGSLAAAGAAEVKTFAPAIFTYLSGNMSQAAVFHANTGIPADQANPAVAGEILEIYGTGLGPTEPFVAAGNPAPASPLARTLVTPEVLIGNSPATVVFSGLTPGFAGLYQVNAVVPSGLRPGQYVVRWRVATATSSGFGAITVR